MQKSRKVGADIDEDERSASDQPKRKVKGVVVVVDAECDTTYAGIEGNITHARRDAECKCKCRNGRQLQHRIDAAGNKAHETPLMPGYTPHATHG